MRYRYYSGAEGRRYCYSSQKSERCPLITQPRGPLELTPHGQLIAAVLDSHGVNGERMILRAHRSTASSAKDGKCPACGHRMDSIGYAVWVEAPWDQIPENTDLSSATRAINERLGSTHGHVPGSFKHLGLKREAIQYCREQAQIDRAAVYEERAARAL